MSDPKSPEKNPKKRKSTARQRRVGKANLLEFRPAAPSQSHGVNSFIATGELPNVEGAREVEKEVSEILAGVEGDLGGTGAVTAAQRVVLAGLRVSLTVQGLAELHLRRVGVYDAKTKKATALLAILATYINSARLSATALGLERRTRNVTKTLATVMSEIAERESGETHEAE